MERIATCPQAHADHSAQELSVLGAGIVGDDVEFLDRIHTGRIGHIVVDELDVFHTVQQIVGRLLAVAINVRTAGIERGLAGVEGRRTGSDRSGH